MRGEQRVGLGDGDPEDVIASTLVPLMPDHPLATGQPEGAFANRNQITPFPCLNSPLFMASHCPSKKTQP